MASFELELDRLVIHERGVGEVFRQSGVVNKLESMGRAIAAEASALTDEHYPKNGIEKSHYKSEQYKTSYGNTAIEVKPTNPLAVRAQSEYSVLTQAMDAGRG